MCNHSQGFYYADRDEGLAVSRRADDVLDVGVLPAYPAPDFEDPEQELWSMERK